MNKQVRRYINQIASYILVMLCSTVLVITWSLVIFNRESDRRQYIDAAVHEANNLANAIAGYLEQAFGSIDQMLVTARHTAIAPEHRSALKQMVEVSHLGGSIINISLFDAAGNLLSSTVPNAPPANIADRGWLKEFHDHADDRLIIGPPVASPVTNQMSVVLARGIRDEQGRFQGMVALSIKPDFFVNYFR